MCCLALPERKPLDEMPIEEIRAEIAAKTPEQRHAEFLEWNAGLPTPHPLCPGCDLILDRRESHPLFPDLCECCGPTRALNLIVDIIYARSKKARRLALKRLDRLARLAC